MDTTYRDRKEVGWEGVDWIDLPQDRDKLQSVADMVMNLLVSEDAKNFLTG